MNVNHNKSLNTLYNGTVNSLTHARVESLQNKKIYKNKKGWTDYVVSLYYSSREARLANPDRDMFMTFIKKVKLDSSMLYDLSRTMKMYYAKALANNLARLNPEAFWHEIKTINNCNSPLPTCTESVTGGKEIVDL